MRKAYLMLLDYFYDEDIYIDHSNQSFEVIVHGENKYVKLSEITDFIINFVDSKKLNNVE